MRGKILSTILFFLFLFLVSSNYGFAEKCDGTIKSKHLELTDCDFNRDDMKITGKIKNTSTEEFGRVYILFSFYNEKGEAVGSSGQGTDYLGPVEVWPIPPINVHDKSVVRVKPVKLREVIMKNDLKLQDTD